MEHRGAREKGLGMVYEWAGEAGARTCGARRAKTMGQEGTGDLAQGVWGPRARGMLAGEGALSGGRSRRKGPGGLGRGRRARRRRRRKGKRRRKEEKGKERGRGKKKLYMVEVVDGMRRPGGCEHLELESYRNWRSTGPHQRCEKENHQKMAPNNFEEVTYNI